MKLIQSEFISRIVFESKKDALNEFRDSFNEFQLSYIVNGDLYEFCVMICQNYSLDFSESEKNIINFIKKYFRSFANVRNINEYQLALEIRNSSERPSIQIGRELMHLLSETGGEIDIDLL